MTNEYGSNSFNDPNFFKQYFQNTKDFELIQTTFDDNLEDKSFCNKKINLCSQNQVSTPPTSPFLYATYEPSSLSCDTSLSSCSSSSSSSLSPILTPTTTISPSHSTLNSISSSLSASPIESQFFENDINDYNSSLVKVEQDSSSSTSYEQYNDDNALEIQSTHFHNNNNNNNNSNNIIEQSQQQHQQQQQQQQQQQLLQQQQQQLLQQQQQQLIQQQLLLQQQQQLLLQQQHKEQMRMLSCIENHQQQYLRSSEFHEQRKIDPEFLNSNSNLFKWTFINPKFPLLFDQMYDKANGCFFLAGIPVEFIFDLYKCNQDLITVDDNEDFI